jgi:hypothetical protein
MYTLMTTQTRAINAQLDEVVIAVKKAELQTTTEDSSRSPLYASPMGGIVGKR